MPSPGNEKTNKRERNKKSAGVNKAIFNAWGRGSSPRPPQPVAEAADPRFAARCCPCPAVAAGPGGGELSPATGGDTEVSGCRCGRSAFWALFLGGIIRISGLPVKVVKAQQAAVPNPAAPVWRRGLVGTRRGPAPPPSPVVVVGGTGGRSPPPRPRAARGRGGGEAAVAPPGTPQRRCCRLPGTPVSSRW